MHPYDNFMAHELGEPLQEKLMMKLVVFQCNTSCNEVHDDSQGKISKLSIQYSSTVQAVSVTFFNEEI